MKHFTCRELFPETPCCEDAENENFCCMQNEPGVPGAVLRVEVHSCCKHAHEARRLPIEFYLEHHVPYAPVTAKIERKKKREDDDDWLW